MDIFSSFFKMRVFCVFSLESPHQVDIYHFQYKKENHPKLCQICSYGIFFSKGFKDEFETAVLNKQSVFEPLKFYCNFLVPDNLL